MYFIEYIKKRGLKHTFAVFYQYKINNFFVKIISVLTKYLPLKDIIVIKSHDDFDCNGGAFYNYLIKNEYNKKYKIVWRLEHKNKKRLPFNVTSVYDHSPSIRKAYYICVAKYFTADCDVIEKVRDKQISYYFTHSGIGIKNVKRYMKLTSSLDYFLSASKNYDMIIDKQYDSSENTKKIHLGFPINDILFEDVKNELDKITLQKYDKVFLWMPTFRKGGGFNRNDSRKELEYGIPLIENELMITKLQLFLNLNNFLLIIKIHPKQDPDSYSKLKSTNNIIVLDGKTVKRLDINIYNLLKSADAFLSDYSSITYSYLLLNRPIGFILSDFEDYIPGFAVENYNDFLVGEKIYTFQDFITFCTDVAEGKDNFKKKRETLTNWLYKYVDGYSCERIVKHMGLKK